MCDSSTSYIWPAALLIHSSTILTKLDSHARCYCGQIGHAVSGVGWITLRLTFRRQWMTAQTEQPSHRQRRLSKHNSAENPYGDLVHLRIAKRFAWTEGARCTVSTMCNSLTTRHKMATRLASFMGDHEGGEVKASACRSEKSVRSPRR